MLRFQAIRRKVHIPGQPAYENDAEHAFAVSFTALYLNDAYELGHDPGELVVKGAVHDIPEIYAGDDDVLDHKGRANKAAREHAATEQIAAEFPEFPSLKVWIKDYELQRTATDRFIYAVDKLLPMLMVYLDNGRTWHERNYSREELLANKRNTTSSDALVSQLTMQLERLIRSNPALFPRQ